MAGSSAGRAADCYSAGRRFDPCPVSHSPLLEGGTNVPQLTVITANIKSNPYMKQAKVVHDVERCAELGDVILWQEMAPKRYKQALRDLGPEWTHAHLNLEVPISWRDDEWELVYEGSILAHEGKATASPNRYIAWVVLRHRATGKLVGFVNSHYVSGAWNGKLKTFKQWRKRMWVQHYALHVELIEALKLLGVPVVGGGDFNRAHVSPFTDDLKWLVNHGIDYLFAVEHDAAITSKGTGACPGFFYTDHQPRKALLTIN